MSGQAWTINSLSSLMAFTKEAERLYANHKHITYAPPRIGKDRSLNQNALFHAWCSEIAAHETGVSKKLVSTGLLEGTKRIMKRKYVLHNPDGKAWMVHKITDPFSDESRSEYTSSASWRKGEMFLVLTWMQMSAAERGLILESKGEFSKLQREQEI